MKNPFSTVFLVSLSVILLSIGGGQPGSQTSLQGIPPALNSRNIKIDSDYGKMPLYFIPNQGQIDEQVAFYVQGKDKTLYFTEDGITFALTKPGTKKEFRSKNGDAGEFHELGEERLKAQEAGPRTKWANPDHIVEREAEHGPAGTSDRWVVKLEFIGANEDVRAIGEAETGAVVSYFRGKPEDWHAGLPTYSKIAYPNLWPGIDLVYYGTVHRLKYEFIVHPGADPSNIRLAYRGAESITLDRDGRLQVKTPAGDISDDIPTAYQDVAGERRTIGLSYALGDKSETENRWRSSKRGPTAKIRTFGFAVGAYDHSQPLVLDPAFLVYCGFIGGSDSDSANGIVVDGAGNAYVAGNTVSAETTFPVTVGPDLAYNGGGSSGYYGDAFVAKVNASGTALVYCGYLGGSGYDSGSGIAVDASGNAFLTGTTESTEATFPVVAGPDLAHNGDADAFVAKVNASGTALLYCGYIGGESPENGNGIAVDGSGNAYVTGFTRSEQDTFPVIVGPDLTFNWNRPTGDAFVAKINPAGTALVYCGYIGGTGNDSAADIAVDGSGNAYIIGDTDSVAASFPVCVGPDVYHNGYSDAFVAKVNLEGTALVYCGFIGGSGTDYGRAIAVDRAGNAYVAGETKSSETAFPVAFPVTVGPDLTFNGGTYDDDAFIAKISDSGASLLYCGYIGGSADDHGTGIAVDDTGNAYVTGDTGSKENTSPVPFPVIMGPDLTQNGHTDAFVAKVNSTGTGLVYCGYVGGSLNDERNSIAVDGSGNAYVAGSTSSTEATFPVTAGPDMTKNGTYDFDAFVAKVCAFDERVPKHAVGDLDGDGSDELVVDFGASGAWTWDAGAWTALTVLDPECLLAADVNGDGLDEVLLSFGTAGLWLVVGGTGYGISSQHLENLAAGDVDGDGAEEVVCDFGAIGLWLFDGGAWTQISGVNADGAAVANIDGTGGDEIAVDFGTLGVWVWRAGVWTQFTGVNADLVIAAKTVGNEYLVGDFGPLGLWTWSMAGGWTKVRSADADYLIALDADGDGADELAADLGPAGLWLWDSGSWSELSGANAVYMISADVDGDGRDEAAVDFSAVGLWLRGGSAWSMLSPIVAEYLFAADLDGDSGDEILADLGAAGLWLWDSGAWSQLSGDDPDQARLSQETVGGGLAPIRPGTHLD